MTFQCENFLKLSPYERFEKPKQLQLCINCLKSSHKISACKSSKCKTCQKLHNTLLHFDAMERPSTNVNSLIATARNYDQGVVLATALVELQGDIKPFQARVFLYSGSQSCLITKSLCDKYKLVQYKTKTCVQGITGA